MTPRFPLPLFLVAVCCLSCGEPPQATPSCPDYRPEGYHAPCDADQACDSYLTCRSGVCELPPAMNGVGETTTREVTFHPPDNLDATVLGLQAETASSEYERSTGLSFRPCILEGWSMLFVHPDPESPKELTYSTEEMEMPVDIAFLDDQKSVVSIFRNVSPGRASIPSGRPASYVIEASAGSLGDLRLGDVARWEEVE